MSVRCANRQVHGNHPTVAHHATVAEVRECFATAGGIASEEQEAQDEQDYLSEGDPDAAYERWLEDAGHDEAMAERAWEDARGVVQFEDALRFAVAAF